LRYRKTITPPPLTLTTTARSKSCGTIYASYQRQVTHRTNCCPPRNVKSCSMPAINALHFLRRATGFLFPDPLVFIIRMAAIALSALNQFTTKFRFRVGQPKEWLCLKVPADGNSGPCSRFWMLLKQKLYGPRRPFAKTFLTNSSTPSPLFGGHLIHGISV